MTATATPFRRALALDALRGFAILTMALSARIPFAENWLPGWMYHGQEGPNPLWYGPHPAGITWVDLVFPMFLFAMGVAFPFALCRRLERGATPVRLIPGVLQRYGLLIFFAIYLQHTVPHVMGDSTLDHWVGLLAFLLLFPIFTRLPEAWPRAAHRGIRLAGWISAIGLLALIRYPDGTGFSLHRGDTIILVLANMALFGSLIWLWTRDNWPLRLGLIALGLVAHASAPAEGRITLGLDRLLNGLNSLPGIDWFFQFLYLKYLCIVLPGTVIGDLLLAWMRGHGGASHPSWSRGRLHALAWLNVALVVCALTGHKARWEILTPIVLLALSGAGLALVRRPASDTERLLRRVFLWGTVWLVVGVLTEPLEGGVKKTPSTLSYYFLTLAQSIELLVALTVWIDVFGLRRTFALLISNGQNPMIAYAGIRGLLGPFYRLTGIDRAITEPLFTQANRWVAALWGLFKTVTLAVFVDLCTRARVFWRS